MSAVAFAAAALFAGSAALDILVLWGFGRSTGAPASELFAIAATVESLPRLVLGVALSLVALYLAGSTLLLAYRALGGLLLATGLAGFGLALLGFMEFVALRSTVPSDQQSAIFSAAAKTVALGGLEAMVLIPAGWRCLRRPS